MTEPTKPTDADVDPVCLQCRFRHARGARHVVPLQSPAPVFARAARPTGDSR